MKYRIRNKKTGKIVEEIEMPISETDKWAKKHPDLEISIGAPAIHSGAGLGLKSMRNDESFKENLKAIDQANPGNTLKNYTSF